VDGFSASERGEADAEVGVARDDEGVVGSEGAAVLERLAGGVVAETVDEVDDPVDKADGGLVGAADAPVGRPKYRSSYFRREALR
jgi:hypothetical protein